MFTWRVTQGQGAAIVVSVSACPVDASIALVGTVSDGTTGAAALPFTPTWSASGPPHVSVILTSAQTAALAPGGYVVHIGLASGGGELAIGTLQVISAPGNLPAFDALTTPARVLLMNPELRNNPDRVAMLPLSLRSASQLIRRSAYRRFTRGEYTEYHTPSLEGGIRLNEFPVNRIVRASRRLDTAITISADPSTFQTAYCNFATSDGTYNDPENLSYTGINLVGTSNGVQLTTTILFSSTPKLSDLATAVNAVSGWKSTADGYGAWATSELYCDGDSRGALDCGVRLRVFSEDVSSSRIDRRTGMYYVGSGRYASDFGQRWGPNWVEFASTGYECDDVVRIKYDAGFTEIPGPIQDATVLMSRIVTDRLLLDMTLKKESIGDYSYELNDKLLGLTVPDAIRGMIYPYTGYTA